MLKFAGEEVVTLELGQRPADGPLQIGTGFSHLVVHVDELARAISTLLQRGLQPEPEQQPAGPDGPWTSWLTDPDGYRIELVQWPAGHADGSPQPTSREARARPGDAPRRAKAITRSAAGPTRSACFPLSPKR